MPAIGSVYSAGTDAFARFAAAFHQGLKEAEYVEIEYRWADGYYDRLPAFAADLVRHQVAVIVAAGGACQTPLGSSRPPHARYQ